MEEDVWSIQLQTFLLGDREEGLDPLPFKSRSLAVFRHCRILALLLRCSSI